MNRWICLCPWMDWLSPKKMPDIPEGRGGRRELLLSYSFLFLAWRLQSKIHTSFMPEGERTFSKTHCKMLTTLKRRHRNRFVRIDSSLPHELGPCCVCIYQWPCHCHLVLGDRRNNWVLFFTFHQNRLRPHKTWYIQSPRYHRFIHWF